MAKALYALLVGIDAYRPPVSPLHGCVNDIARVESLLQGLGASGNFDLHLSCLRNEQSTRAGIVQAFRKHLQRAGADDVALFYYCGHGSQEAAPPELWPFEPDRLNETLVCYDSRDGNNWDLADKELSLLISDVAASGCHMLCVFDCCHSGSGTRDVLDAGSVVRHAPVHLRERPLASFLDGELAARLGQDGAGALPASLALPAGRHVLLAACRAHETAKEIIDGGTPRGAFTMSLLEVLEKAQGRIAYHDLIKRVEAQIRLRVVRQVPRIEASEPTDLLMNFLGGPASARRADFTLRYDQDHGWVVDAGAVHGIAWPRGQETTRFAVFDIDAGPAGSHRIAQARAIARVTAVRPELSRVDLAAPTGGSDPPSAPAGAMDDLDRKSTYHAVVVSTPRPPVAVHFSGSREAVDALRQALAGRQDWSAMLREVPAADDASLRVSAEEGIYRISHVSGRRSPAANRMTRDEADAGRVAERLAHMARWEIVAGLENPGSLLGDRPVPISVHLPRDGPGTTQWDEVDVRTGLRLEYRELNGTWHKPRLRITLTNASDHDVYCALLWLGEDDSISSGLMPGGAEIIPAKRSFTLNNGQDIYASVPDDKWRAGRTEVRDVLKLFVSTEQFDPTLFDQPAWGRSSTTRDAKAGRSREVLAWFAASSRTRTFSLTPYETFPEWTTSEWLVDVVRPPAAEPRPPARHVEQEESK